MLMAKSEGSSWKGGSIYISYNTNADPGDGDASQQWSKPQVLINRPGHIIWYPSLQPVNSDLDVKEKYTCLRTGQLTRLFFKDQYNGTSEYVSEYQLRFEK